MISNTERLIADIIRDEELRLIPVPTRAEFPMPMRRAVLKGRLENRPA